ncbi:hypothetical protein SynPROS71_01945 [Synechococcus sp. PROS-7-1]|nr:hypothetical protein SynPROS71_01945 [Synechococcus sp. PROS-7-1]
MHQAELLLPWCIGHLKGNTGLCAWLQAPTRLNGQDLRWWRQLHQLGSSLGAPSLRQ